MLRLFCTVTLAFLLFAAGSCSKKDAAVDPYPADSLGRINRWVLDSMRRYYYWSDEIPASPDYSLQTDLFFKSLLSSKDRFSWITNGGSVEAASSSYFIYGFQYALVSVAGYNGYIGVITLVNTGSAADKAGLQRGSCFVQVNNAGINEQNKNEIIRQLKTGTQVSITPAVYSNGNWTTSAAVKLTNRYAGENAVHAIRNFTAGGISTGYLFYNSFDENYDAALLQAFTKLQQVPVKELILDLRYNAGGSVASSAKLAAMIASGITADATWVIFEGNRYEGKRGRSLQTMLNTSGNNAGKQFSDLATRRLSLKRVFILTTAATYSAAELVVNNLKPYIEVIQIGESTAGKDEASFTIEDYRVPKQVMWKVQPAVYKVYNSNSQGAYSKGIHPLYPVNELTQLPLYNIGTTADPLVNKALQIIYGTDLPDNFIALRNTSSSLPIQPVYRSASDGNGLKMILKP